jgi:Uma2 family endonuclease
MGEPAPAYDGSLDGFLAWEAAQPERWERVAGVVRMMAGGTSRHNLIAGNVYVLLRGALRGRSCAVYLADFKVVSPGEESTYPDVMVVCPPLPPTATSTAAPALVVEVLSESTRKDDDTRKRWLYQSIPSLRCYVLVDQEAVAVEVCRRGADGRWVSDPVARDLAASVPVEPEFGVELPLAAVYEGVSFGTG